MPDPKQPPMTLAEALKRLGDLGSPQPLPWANENIASPAAILRHTMGLQELTAEQLGAIKHSPVVESFFNECLIEFGKWRSSEEAAKAMILQLQPEAKNALYLPGLRLLPMVGGAGAGSLEIAASVIGTKGETVFDVPSLPGRRQGLRLSDLSSGVDTVANAMVTLDVSASKIRIDCAAFPAATWHFYFLGSVLPEDSTALDRHVFLLCKTRPSEPSREAPALWDLISEGRIIEALAIANHDFADDQRVLTCVHWALAARMELLVRQAIPAIEFRKVEHARFRNALVEIADRQLDAVKQAMIERIGRQE